MISAWMAYGIAVTLLVGLAAFGLELWLQERGSAVRWVWVGALISTLVVPIATIAADRVSGGRGPAVAAVPTSVDEMSSGGTAPDRVETSARKPPLQDGTLLAVWLLSSVGVFLYGFRSWIRLRRSARIWEEETVDGRRVKVSHDIGPAVVGFLRSRIVVPRWVVDTDREARAMILTHEEEHIRARDPQLLLAALVLLLSLPWNLPLWWMVHRLRLAIEVDCDARVVRTGVEPRAYGSLLLDVSGGGTATGLVAALANPASFLERRIRAITRRAMRPSWKTSAGALSVGCALLLVACNLDAPPLPSGGEVEEQTSVGSPGGGPAPSVVPDVGPGSEPGAGGSGAQARSVVEQSANEPGAGSGVGAEEGPTTNGTDELYFLKFIPADTPRVPVTVRQRDTTDIDTPPSPAATGRMQDISQSPVFSPREVEPRLTNTSQFTQQLERRYPPALKEAGIGGTVLLFVFVTENGEVGNVRVQQSSGYPQLDQLALDLMLGVAVFEPAYNRGQPVPVWMQIPVTFEALAR